MVCLISSGNGVIKETKIKFTWAIPLSAFEVVDTRSNTLLTTIVNDESTFFNRKLAHDRGDQIRQLKIK